jgi:acetyl-CoA carboxylase alpha subunit
MDAVRKRREYIIWEKSIEEEKKRIEFLKQMKQETMRCNVISQRIALQEYLADKQEQIAADLDLWADDEKSKTLKRDAVDAMLDDWLADFALVQPSQFFRDHPTNDSELVCGIQAEKEFMLTTLEFFGLPKKYMEGKGHFPMWGKEKNDDKKTAMRKKA